MLSYTGGGHYVTVGPTEYIGDTDIIHIPAGFATDLATVPRIFWALLPPHGAYEKAAVLHDYLCVELASCHRTDRVPQVNARDTDGLFRRVMREADTAARRAGNRKGRIGPVTRWAMWTGVRWGALANPARRDGWWRDAPTVLGITGAGIAATVTAVRAADRLAHRIVR